MTNPLYGIYLGNKFYSFDSSSYRLSYATKNRVHVTQGTRTADLNGIDLATHTLVLLLENTYYTYSLADNSQSSGTTTWLGVSRLVDLRTMVGGLGSSMPLTFVAPDGLTHSVIPTGSLDVSLYKPETGSQREYQVSITLENIE